jgi:nucleotide-binding universal stress UspA family protein
LRHPFGDTMMGQGAASHRSSTSLFPCDELGRLAVAAPLEAVMTRRKVLVPLDGSDFGSSAFRTVGRLFDPASTDVTLVHVTPVPDGIPYTFPEPVVAGAQDPWSHAPYKQTLFSSQEWESTRAEVLTSMSDDAERLSQAGFDVTRVVRFGDPAQEIADLVEESDFDAVVMATHGRTGLSRAVMGSVAESVVRMVRAPVVMVHTRQPGTEPEPVQRFE